MPSINPANRIQPIAPKNLEPVEKAIEAVKPLREPVVSDLKADHGILNRAWRGFLNILSPNVLRPAVPDDLHTLNDAWIFSELLKFQYDSNIDWSMVKAGDQVGALQKFYKTAYGQELKSEQVEQKFIDSNNAPQKTDLTVVRSAKANPKQALVLLGGRGSGPGFGEVEKAMNIYEGKINRDLYLATAYGQSTRDEIGKPGAQPATCTWGINESMDALNALDEAVKDGKTEITLIATSMGAAAIQMLLCQVDLAERYSGVNIKIALDSPYKSLRESLSFFVPSSLLLTPLLDRVEEKIASNLSTAQEPDLDQLSPIGKLTSPEGSEIFKKNMHSGRVQVAWLYNPADRVTGVGGLDLYTQAQKLGVPERSIKLIKYEATLNPEKDRSHNLLKNSKKGMAEIRAYLN